MFMGRSFPNISSPRKGPFWEEVLFHPSVELAWAREASSFWSDFTPKARRSSRMMGLALKLLSTLMGCMKTLKWLELKASGVLARVVAIAGPGQFSEKHLGKKRDAKNQPSEELSGRWAKNFARTQKTKTNWKVAILLLPPALPMGSCPEGWGGRQWPLQAAGRALPALPVFILPAPGRQGSGSDASDPPSALSFLGRSARPWNLGLLTLHFALNWLKADPPDQGHAAVVSVGSFSALPSRRTDFLLSAEKCSPGWCLLLNICTVVLTPPPVITWIADCLITMWKSCHWNDDLELIFNRFWVMLIAATGDFAMWVASCHFFPPYFYSDSLGNCDLPAWCALGEGHSASCICHINTVFPFRATESRLLPRCVSLISTYGKAAGTEPRIKRATCCETQHLLK